MGEGRGGLDDKQAGVAVYTQLLEETRSEGMRGPKGCLSRTTHHATVYFYFPFSFLCVWIGQGNKGLDEIPKNSRSRRQMGNVVRVCQVRLGFGGSGCENSRGRHIKG